MNSRLLVYVSAATDATENHSHAAVKRPYRYNDGVKSLPTDRRLILSLLVFALATAAQAAPPKLTVRSAGPQTNAVAMNAAAQQLYTKAMAAAQAGDYAGAAALCRQVIRTVPTAAPVWGTLARLLALQQQLPDAISAARMAIRLSPKTVGYQADLSQYLMQFGNTAEAEAAAKQALALDPKSDPALSTLATCLMQAKHPADAIPILRRLQDVRGGTDRAVGQGLIAAQLQTGDVKGALASAKTLAAKRLTDAELWLGVADLGMRVDDAAAVKEATDKLVLFAPKSPLPYYYRGRLLFGDTKVPIANRFQRAEAQFQKAVNMAPGESIFRSQLGIAQALEGKDHFTSARVNLNIALLQNNHDIVARRGLALIGERTADWDSAAVQYDALVRLAPNDDTARRRYAGVLINDHRRQEAYRQFWVLISHNPKDVVYLKELASYFLVDQSFADARSAYAQVLERVPNDPDGLLGSARCYAEEGDKKKAESFYLQTIERIPKKETAYLLLAQVYTDDGATADSIHILERLVAAIPDNNSGRLMLIERYITAKRDDDARREIAKLTLRKGDPNRTSYRLAAGNLMMVRQHYAEAAAEFARIADEEPNNADIALALADADSKAGKADDARTLYEKAAHLCEVTLLKDPSNGNVRASLVRARTAQGTPEKAAAFLRQIGAPADATKPPVSSTGGEVETKQVSASGSGNHAQR